MNDFLMNYGLWAVAIGCFFEGQVVLAGAGILASHHLLDPFEVWAVGFFSAWIGHLFWFGIGKIMITRGIHPNRHPRTGTTMNQIDRLIRKNPWLSVFLLQYFYGARLIGAIAFGFSRLKVQWFALAQTINCLIWALCVAGFGFLVGESLNSSTQSSLRIVWIVGTLAILAVWWWFVSRHPIRQESIDESSRMVFSSSD